MKSKVLAFLLALTILAPSLIACGNNTTETAQSPVPSDTTQQESATETETEPEPETEPAVNLYANLGEADFNDRTFTMMFKNEEKSRFAFIEDYTGEPIDNAVFEANSKVMDLANIVLKVIHNNDPLGALAAANKSGDINFDITTDAQVATSSMAGHMLNLQRLPHIDWDEEWWPQNTMDALSLGGTTLMFSNYSSYANQDGTFAIFANMDLIDQYGMEHPHDMIKENRWILDEFIAMTRDVYDDVNGDGLMEQNVDRWSFANVAYFYCYFEAWNIEIFDKTEDGNSLYLNVGENIANLMEKLYGFFCESPGVYHNGNPEATDEHIMFLNRNTIFVYKKLGFVEDLRNTGITYAILPLPKLDETVEEYGSGCDDNPMCAARIYPEKDYDFLGYVLEAMAIAGYEIIYPAYVDTALKYRYSPTEDDSEVIDMIFKNRRFGFSWMYNNNLFPRMMEHLFTYDGFNYASYVAANMKKNQAWVERLQANFEALG